MFRKKSAGKAPIIIGSWKFDIGYSRSSQGGVASIFIIIVFLVLISFSVNAIRNIYFGGVKASPEPGPEAPLVSPSPSPRIIPVFKPSPKASPSVLASQAPVSSSPVPSVSFPSPSPSLPGTPAFSDGHISVDKVSVSVTLSRSQAQNGYSYGSGIRITSVDATGFQIKYNETTSGQGFDLLSGGMNPGVSVDLKSFIKTSKPDGIYSGSAVLSYYKDGLWYEGPTINYSITLVD